MQSLGHSWTGGFEADKRTGLPWHSHPSDGLLCGREIQLSQRQGFLVQRNNREEKLEDVAKREGKTITLTRYKYSQTILLKDSVDWDEG